MMQQPGIPQQGVQGPEQIEDTIAGILDENPQMKQQIHQALQQGDAQGVFDQLSPEESQQMIGMLQQIVENPASYPQVYQQIMQSGANPADFPPPDSPPEQIEQFAAALLVVMFYIGKLGQTGGGQAPTPGGQPQGGQPQGGQPPVQGYPDGGIVGQQGPQLSQYNPAAMRNMNYANLMTQENANNALATLPQTQTTGQGTLYTANDPEFAKLRIAEQMQLHDDYQNSPNFRGFNNQDPRFAPTVIRGQVYNNDPASQANTAARYNTNPYAGKSVDDVYNDIPLVNVNPVRGGGSARPDMRPMAQGDPNIHWSPQGFGLDMLKTPGTHRFSARGVNYGTTDPWEKEYGGAYTGARFGATYYGWQDADSKRLNPVRSQQQLDTYLDKGDFSSGKADWAGGQPLKHRRETPHQGDLRHQNYAASFAEGYEPYSLPGLSGQSSGSHKTYIFGFPDGGVVPPTANPMQTNTGDDQMIAAKTGEGVLNVAAVNAIGGPDVVNQLNYQASGEIPGGQPVVQTGAQGYGYGGIVKQKKGYSYGGIVSDRDPGAVAGFNQGGVIGDEQEDLVGSPVPTNIAQSNWVWSEQSNRYVEADRQQQPFSGTMIEAMSFWGVFSKALGTIVSIAASIVVPGAGALVGVTSALGSAAVSAVAGAVFGAAIGGITTGSLKGALAGGAIGAVSGAISGYFTFGGGGPGGGAGGGSFGATQGAANANAAFGPAPGGLGGFNTNLSQAAGLGAGTTQAAGALGGIGTQAGTGPILGQAGAGGLNAPIGATTSNQGVVGNTGIGAKANQVVGGIVDRLTDPKNLSYAGTKLLGSVLTEQPDFGADQYSAAANAALAQQNALLNTQRDQYNRNVPGLQNQATNIASLAASPQTMATQSANQYKLQNEQERRRLQDSLSRQNKGPGTQAYIDAMRKFNSDAGLGRIQSYNTGYQRGVNQGITGLSNAKNMHDLPNYASAAGQYASVGANNAQIKRDEWNARNQAASATGRLFFPPDPEEEGRRTQQLSMGMQV